MSLTISAAIHLAQSLDYRVYLTDCGGQREFWPYPGDTLGPSSKKQPLMEAEAFVSTPHFYVGNPDIYGNHKAGPNGCLGQLQAPRSTERRSLIYSCYGASAATSLRVRLQQVSVQVWYEEISFEDSKRDAPPPATPPPFPFSLSI